MPRLGPLRGATCIILAGLLAAGGAQAATDLKGRKLDVDPKVVKPGKLVYPEVLSYNPERAFRGSVVVQLIVDENGEVLEPKITQVTHPAFVPPALDALFATKFSPGMVGSSPVASRLIYTFPFDVKGYVQGKNFNGGLDPFTLPRETPPDCPPQYRYDVAPRPVLICEPVYPRELLLAGDKGDTTVVFIIDETGRVAETKVLSATKPEFGAAMRAAVEAWRFTPPQLERRKTSTLVSRSQRFSPFNQDLQADDEVGRVLRLLRAGGEKLVDAKTLTQMPKPRYEPPPVYPTAFEEKRVTGEAQVEFVIDRKGRVRLPRIVSASHPLFGWAAANAVQQWYYEPPQVDARAVDIRVVLPIKFTPPPAK